MFSILYSKNLTDLSIEKYKIIKAFINFCVDDLGITEDFRVFLFHADDTNRPEMSLACYEPETNDVWARVNGRIVMDINRSIAHELVHLQQKQQDRLNMESYTDVGGPVEDEANAVAGQLCKKFIYAFDCKWIYSI